MNFCRKATTHASQPKYTGLDGPQTLEIEDVIVRKSTIHLAPGCVESETPPLNLLVDNKEDPFVILTDETVHELYTRDFANNLRLQGANLVDLIVLPASESAKTLQVYTDTLYRLEANEKCTGSVTLVSLGGAVVSNVTGYLAATLKRGVRFVSMPTTLLAQCDGCISFKQAVNGRVAKNQFGAYYAAANIVLDMKVLDTLPDRNFLDGFGEVIKHALCQDLKMVRQLEKIDVDAMLGDRSIAYPLIWKAVQCKLQCMAACPPENHAVLQYGHQYGHGIEKAANFEYGHGECVGVGMVATDYLGMLMGLNDARVLERTATLTAKYGLPICIGKSVSLDKVWDAMVHDKAFVNGQHRVNFAQPIERNHEFIVIPHELIRQGLSYISSYELMFYNGDCVPKVAYGTTSSTTSEEVNEAIQAGVRHFVYSAASSPASIQAMATALSTSSLSRDDVTISLTVLTDMKVPLIAQTRALLDALSTDAADLVKLSVTAEAKEITDEEIVIGMWQDMEGLKRAKVAKNLGLANSSIRQLEIILENCSVKPVSLDMVCPSTPIIAELVFCEAHNVRLVATVQELKADELLQSEFKSDSKYTSNRTPSQMTLRCYTTRGMGLILEGDVSQDLKNFSLDFTIPSDNMFYTDVVSGAASNLMTPDDSDHEDNGPRKPLQLMRFQTVRSCESLFSLRYNRSMDSLGVMRSRNSSSDSLAAISRNISREALASISRNMSTDSLADMDLGVLPPLTELE